MAQGIANYLADDKQKYEALLLREIDHKLPEIDTDDNLLSSGHHS